MSSRPHADDHLPEKRIDPPAAGSEKETLTGFLDYHRQTLLLKCAGLDPQQLIARASPPSTLCLLGLVRHLTEVEYGWLCECFAGLPAYDRYGPGDADFEVSEADEQSVADTFAGYTEQIARSTQIVAESEVTTLARTEERSLRWILVHLIEEYARHNGHADLLRQAIDGSVGE